MKPKIDPNLLDLLAGQVDSAPSLTLKGSVKIGSVKIGTSANHLGAIMRIVSKKLVFKVCT